MRLRTFNGRTTAEAMALVRAHLGEDAVIVSAQDDGNGGVRVTAALDTDMQDTEGSTASYQDFGHAAVIRDSLMYHGVSTRQIDALIAAAGNTGAESAIGALAGGLESVHRFESLQHGPRKIALIGPPAGGKTATAAKLAARCVIAGERVRLISTDMSRAGGIAQLESFARILQAPFVTASGAAELGAALAASDASETVFVDTAGANPFNTGDRKELTALLAGLDAEPVLVFAAGGDVADTIEMARVFRDLGCTRAVVTRLDAAQRLGAVLTASAALNIGLAEAGIAPDIADGLIPLTAALLARLLLPKGAE